MPVFAYEGRSASGETKKGNIEATDLEAAKARLPPSKLRFRSPPPTSFTRSSTSHTLPGPIGRPHPRSKRAKCMRLATRRPSPSRVAEN